MRHFRCHRAAALGQVEDGHLMVKEYRQVSSQGEIRTFSIGTSELSLADHVRRDGVSPETFHHACFISFLAMREGLATLDEILGDYGLIHEMAHVMLFGEKVSPLAASTNDLADLAQRVEGVLAEKYETVTKRG